MPSISVLVVLRFEIVICSKALIDSVPSLFASIRDEIVARVDCGGRLDSEGFHSP